TIIVRAEDDPHDLAKPRGKQDWQLEPHGIWYPRTTGIWQTVWLEPVHETYIRSLRWTPNVERWEISLLGHIQGHNHGDLAIRVKLTSSDRTLADDTYSIANGEVQRRIGLADPGIEDYRNELLWRPAFPTLIHADVHLLRNGKVIDEVQSYTALRSIDIQGDRFILNGSPYHLRMVLDQGYWEKTGQTPPSDEALRKDVELARLMGFNGVRKHQKIEDPRYLYWADTLGMLVWEEMPSAYRFNAQSVERLTREWIDVIERDVSHPCIVAWVPFNESWGVPNLPDSPPQRHYIQGLYHLTRTLDPTRPVIGNDGWEAVATDIIGIHDYDDQPARIRKRYTTDEMQHRLRRERPGGRLLVLDDDIGYPLPLMLSEFGGIAYNAGEQSRDEWGYSVADSADNLAERYTALLQAVRSLEVLCGFCYTQFSDTYQEINGLLHADRTPKFPLEQIHHATYGVRTPRDRQVEAEWRERLMLLQRRHHQMPAEDHRVQQG
ncbi:MAG: glycoside hydrolase family 2 TIM barrel-domain containing protein, partial [Phycisphaeraceae bacterium]